MRDHSHGSFPIPWDLYKKIYFILFYHLWLKDQGCQIRKDQCCRCSYCRHLEASPEQPDKSILINSTEIIIAGMGAETVLEILDAAPWVRNEQYNFVFVPATKHSVLRKGLAQRGFALKSETLCRAAGRLYTVINAQYTGRAAEPTGLACLCGKTQGQPEAQAYREQQLVKLKKYRLGLTPGPQADGVDALIQEMEDGLWP